MAVFHANYLTCIIKCEDNKYTGWQLLEGKWVAGWAKKVKVLSKTKQNKTHRHSQQYGDWQGKGGGAGGGGEAG